MNYLLRSLMHRVYQAPAGDDGGEGGGGAGGADKIAAALAAEKEAAAAAAATKEAEDAAAAAAEKLKKEGGGDGGRRPTDEEAKLLKEVMQKKGALNDANAALAAAQEQLKKFEGIDPEAVRALLKEKTDAETAALEAKGEWTRLKERMATEHAAGTAALQAQIDALKADLGKRDGLINDLTIGTQFTSSQFITNELALTPAKARVIYGEHFELVDGKVVGYDKPRSASDRTPIVDASGNTLSFDEAFKKIVDADPEKDFLLKSKVKSGAGSASSVAAAKAAGTVTKVDPEVTGVSRIASGLKGLNIKLN